MASHVLDFNQRTGYDATSTASLDSRDLTKPYVDPLSGAFSADAFGSELVLPAAWTQGYQTADYEFTVNAYDLWGNLETITGSLAAVPEPLATTAVAGAALLGFALWRCRGKHRQT